MCGVVGVWLKPGRPIPRESLLAMNTALAQRGPDDSGEWVDAAEGVGLGHRRLSIQDLSASGHQPMESADGRYVISYNGEVYNFRELRAELAREQNGSGQFRGTSDTEVILAAISAWGLAEALARFVGMFAFALWDKQTRRLTLVRDRLGVKPLYYARIEGGVTFASELKAIVCWPDFSRELEPSAFAEYAAFGYVGEQRAIFRDARKVEPGTILTFAEPSFAAGRVERYWDASERMANALANPLRGDEVEVAEQVDAALAESVGSRLVADVPVGAFLSGGVDSSLVVAYMRRLSTAAVKTFCVRNPDADYDESEYARRVAAELGTDHSVLDVSPADAVNVLRELPTVYDEPFADSSQLPTLLVSRFARTKVTVALSGDGGDEAFAGYNRYLWLPRFWKLGELLGPTARSSLAGFLDGPVARALDALPRSLAARAPVRLPADKVRKIARVLRARRFEEAYSALCRLGHETAMAPPSRDLPQVDRWDAPMRLMLWDTLTYLPGDILTKVDRASMAVSLEAREPLLDHRLIELSWRIPLKMKLDREHGKKVLRTLLARHIPRELIERPKAGFSVPVGRWLRGPLREWARERIEAAQLGGLFDARKLRELWTQHVEERTDAGAALWSVIVFQSWAEKYRAS
jgi:asparagine synthase (glutamine-hydrolysing)